MTGPRWLMSEESGPHLAVLTLTFLKTPGEVGQLALTVTHDHCRLPTLLWLISGHLCFSWQECSCPLPSFLPSWEGAGCLRAVAWWAWNLGKEGWGRRQITQTLVGLVNRLHSKQRGPLQRLGWAWPSENACLLDRAEWVHSASGCLWTLDFL